ncbi:hypothetical protein [Engelhardtia mirabilis]|uniref:Right handed beta helix domain-containing protein n=1 Tax=Engelhardtia mirabilis TaxID=2528011 RepID=A0A518BMG9_9BACT|nr:hypothetical protein Pla133_32300 [Planctomycetes bacterium Pla133]QDV02462.1 hypothetical protein Pla86_32290 [Planctomycetes bacterium Pla86]
MNTHFRLLPCAARCGILLAAAIAAVPSTGRAQSVLSVSGSGASMDATQVYFAITAKSEDLRICGLSYVRDDQDSKGIAYFSSADVSVWSAPSGTSTTSQAGWLPSFVGTITPEFASTLTYVPFDIDIEIPAGETRSVSVISVDGAGGPIDETIGLAVQQVSGLGITENDDLIVGPGSSSGSTTTFTGGQTPAVFYGLLHYAVGDDPCGTGDLPITLLPPMLYDGPEPGGVGPLSAGQVYVVQPGTFGWAEIPPGKTLTTAPNTIIKLGNGSEAASRINVKGTANWNDTAVTSIYDDEIGGDTDGQLGLTSREPMAGDFEGLHFQASSDDSIWDGGSVRFAGSNSSLAPVHLFDTDATVRNLIVTDNAAPGGFVIDANDRGQPTVERNFIADNGGAAIGGVSFDMLGGFLDNLALNNAVGDYLQITGSKIGCTSTGPTAVTKDVNVTTSHFPGPVLVIDGNVCVQSGAMLTFGPGIAIKFTPGTGGAIEARSGSVLEFNGTGAEPIRLASLGNDSLVGDTDKNGADTAAPGDLRGIHFAPGSIGRMVHTEVHDGGVGGAAITLQSSQVAAEALVSERSSTRGLEVSALQGDLFNLQVRGSLGDGIYASGFGGSIEHATVTDSGGDGFGTAGGTFSGKVRNSIAWNSVGSNFGLGFDAGNVSYSLGGFTTGSGNLNQDPLLDVQGVPSANSPVVDAGQSGGGQFTDLDDGDRFAIGTLGPYPDMGALEYRKADLTAEPFAAGESVSITATSPLGDGLPTVFAVGVPNAVYLPGLGLIGFDVASFLILGLGLTGTEFLVPTPAQAPGGTSLVGVHYAFQAFVATPADGLVPTPFAELTAQSKVFAD